MNKETIPTGRELVENKLFKPFLKKTAQYVGVELEFPILHIGDKNSKELGVNYLKQLVDDGLFFEEVLALSPELMRVNNSKGDSISYDYSYAVIEFSLAKAHSLTDLHERFTKYFNSALEYYRSHGCDIVGLGTNPDPPNEIHYVNSSYCRALRKFIENYTPQKDPAYYLCNMQSIQTHVEIEGEDLVEVYNLMNRLDFARAYLFSNSPPHERNLPPGISYAEGTVCARDFNWEGSGFPNTGICDKHMSNIDELIDYYTNKMMCFSLSGLEFDCFEPVPVEEYFSVDRGEQGFAGYFNVERVTINQYNVLEFRGDCTQPLEKSFAPAAFNVGLCYNFRAADEVTKRFFADNNISLSNSELRKLAITGKMIVDKDILTKFLQNLTDIAREGLKMRGFSEEALLG